jgi:leader peptidase (prepilin peptidase) / N-methyltransferase
MQASAIVASVPVGLVVGSLLTMVVDRVPDDELVISAPRCPMCSHPLGARELLPVVSWVRQRGRCAHCQGRITVAYPIVELVTAAAFALAAARFSSWWVVVPFWLFFATLIAVSTIDVYCYRIPDRVVFPTLLVGFVAIVVVSQHFSLPEAVARALIGAILFSGVLFVMSIMPGGGMGFGDVKLALVLGLFIGWISTSLNGVIVLVFLALMLGSLLGAVMGLAVGFLRVKTGREFLPDPDLEAGALLQLPWTKQPFPFGPALSLASAVAVTVSNHVT